MIRFKDVIEVAKEDKDKGISRKCLVYLNGEDIVNLFSSGDLIYNPEIQRGYEEKKINGKLVEVPIKKEKKVQNIFKDMDAGKFCESTLTFNLNADKGYTAELEREHNGRLNLVIDGILEILDGYHRISGLMELKEKGEKYTPSNYSFPVEVTMLNTIKAQTKFYQLTLSSKIATSRSEYFNHDDVANDIIRELMEGALKDKVELSKNVIPKSSKDKVVTFATLNNALKSYNGLEALTDDEVKSLTKYLNHFFLELFSIFEGFDDAGIRKHGSILKIKYDNFAFYGYMALAFELYTRECEAGDYELMTKQMQSLKDFDLNRDSVYFKDITKVKIDSAGNKKYTLLNNLTTRKAIGIIFIKQLKIILRGDKLS